MIGIENKHIFLSSLWEAAHWIQLPVAVYSPMSYLLKSPPPEEVNGTWTKVQRARLSPILVCMSTYNHHFSANVPLSVSEINVMRVLGKVPWGFGVSGWSQHSANPLLPAWAFRPAVGGKGELWPGKTGGFFEVLGIFQWRLWCGLSCKTAQTVSITLW